MATQVRAGFEMDVPGVPGRVFFPWHLDDTGKNLVLIDRISNMTPADFFYAAEDEHERERGPVLLGLMATSIRAKYSDWSVERIIRLVMDIQMEKVEFIGGDEDKPAPPEDPGGDADTPEPSETPSESADTTSETSSSTSPSSTDPGSPESTT